MPNNFSKKQIIIIAIIILVMIFVAIFLTLRNQSKKGLKLKINQPTSLAIHSVMSSTLSQDGSKIYYFDSIRRIFGQYDIVSGKKSDLNDKTFKNVYYVTWSPDKSQALLSTSEKDDQNQFETSSYIVNLSNGESKTINLNNLNNLYWSNQKNQIVYSVTNKDDYNIDDIYIANYDGTNAKKVTQIKDFGAPLAFNWTKLNTIEIFKSFFNPPETFLSEADQSSFLVSLNLTTGKLASENIGKDVSDISFSPYGDYAALRKEIDTSFQIKDKNGLHDTKTPMDTSRSLSWSQDNQFLISFSINNNGSAVDIYKIALNDYSSKKITEFQTNKTNIVSIDNGMIYNLGKYLFFSSDSTLYGLKTNL